MSMRRKDVLFSLVLLVVVLYLVANISAINSFLSFSTDKTLDVGNSQVVVPESWNTTSELNMTNKAKTNDSITNGYVIWNIWEEWPENHISSISTNRFKSMEKNEYQVINESTVELGGQNVSKQYFYLPSRDNNRVWDCIGLNYVFTKEDMNYAIQIQYFTKADYNNLTFQKELDDRFEDVMANIHNKGYDGFFSRINSLISLEEPD